MRSYLMFLQANGTASPTAEFVSIASGCRRPDVACRAGHRRVVRLMAADAARHRGYARRLGHGVELTDVAVARRALHARLHMSPVRPGDPWSDLIDAHPGNRLTQFGEVRQLGD